LSPKCAARKARDGHYDRPLIATIEGCRLKGSDYVWHAYRRQLDRSPHFLTPTRQAELQATDLVEAFRADDGTNPMPAFDLHLAVARAYGHDMSALGWTATDVISLARSSERPRTALLDLLAHIGG
jgi:hypothetical protein